LLSIDFASCYDCLNQKWCPDSKLEKSDDPPSFVTRDENSFCEKVFYKKDDSRIRRDVKRKAEIYM